MITDKIKANAIALLKLGDSPEQISDELEIPLMLIREWAEDLGIDHMTELRANANALTRIVEGQLIGSSESNAELLRVKIEETALKIVAEVERNVNFPDLPSAKALQLLADTCSKLYSTVINKGQSTIPQNPGQQALSMFEQLSKD